MVSNMLALLKRSDADLFRLHQGDWEEAAQRLCMDHPFSVTPVLIIPCVSGVDGIARRLQAYSVGKQWFDCPPATAVKAFTEEVVGALTAGDDQVAAQESHPEASPELAHEAALPDDCTSEDAVSEGDELWDHVEPCAGKDADKASDIRSALGASLGKEHAKRVLRKTRPSTTKNNSGQPTRMLRVGTHFLKLKR